MRKINLITASIRAAVVVTTLGGFSAFAQNEEEQISSVQVAQREAEEVEEVEEADEFEEIERVEVTGSRIKSNELEGVSPLTIISADDMVKKGFATAYDALKDLTANTGTTQGAEMASSGGFTPNAQTVSLRGLGNNQVLVLVNGRRVADYPAPYNGASNFVNLSSIPMAAIANIQILTSGASAIYGSDAVAGVMNIITKKNVEDTTFSAKVGTTTEGGGDESRFQLVSGYNTESFTLTGAVEYQKQEPIYSADRDFMDSVDDGPAGHQYLDRGIVIVDEMVKNGFHQDYDDDPDDGINENWTLYRDPNAGINGDRCAASGSGYEYTQRLQNEGEEDELDYGKYCGTDLSGTRSIRNERETISAYLSGEYNLTDDTVIYTDVMYSQQDAFVRGSFFFVNSPVIHKQLEGEGEGNMAPAAELGLGEDFDMAAEYDWRTEQRLFAEHELGFQSSTIEDASLQVNFGLKGLIFDDYEWDIGFSRSENTNDKYSKLLKEEGVVNTFLGGYNTYNYEEWGIEHYDGLGTHDLYARLDDPALRDVLTGTQLTSADSFSNTVSLLLTGPLMELPAGDVYFAATAEWNEQGYDIELDDRTLNTDGKGWYNVTGTEGGGERERYAVGLELQIPVMDDLNLQLAGRYDQYDDDTTDVGGRFSPQVGIEYRPTEDLLVRSSWGKSFRAPDMHRVFATEGGYYTSGVDYSSCEDTYYESKKDDDGDLPDDIEAFEGENCISQSMKGNSSGSKTLEEEEGTNYGVGFVWDLTDSLNVTVDWYMIEIENLVIGESISNILVTDFYCKERQTTDEDGDNYYPHEQNDRLDIVPGSQQCLDNAEKINRSDTENFAGNFPVESVSTSHINAAKQTTEGVDAKIGYHYESSFGDWYMNMGWTHTLDSTFQSDKGEEEIHTRDLWWNSAARSNMNGSVTWAQEDLSITFSGRRTGSIPIANPSESFGDEDSYYYQKVQRLDPYYTFNLTSSYSWNDNLSIRGQVVNLFNPKPPKDESQTWWPYYNSGQYGGAAIGRTVSAEVTYVF